MRHPGQTAACHNEFGVRSGCSQIVEAQRLFSEGEPGAGQHESVLPSGTALVHGEALTGRGADYDAVNRYVRVTHEISHQSARRSPRRVYRSHRSAERSGEAGYVDSAATGIVTGALTTDLVGVTEISAFVVMSSAGFIVRVTIAD